MNINVVLIGDTVVPLLETVNKHRICLQQENIHNKYIDHKM